MPYHARARGLETARQTIVPAAFQVPPHAKLHMNAQLGRWEPRRYAQLGNCDLRMFSCARARACKHAHMQTRALTQHHLLTARHGVTTVPPRISSSSMKARNAYQRLRLNKPAEMTRHTRNNAKAKPAPDPPRAHLGSRSILSCTRFEVGFDKLQSPPPARAH